MCANLDASMDFLKDFPFFKDLDEVHLEEIAGKLISSKFPAGTRVSWEGEPCDGIYFIRSGWLKVTRSSERGRELTLNLLKKGDSFNLIPIFTDNLNPANVVVLEHAELFLLDSGSFIKVVLSSPEICIKLMHQMASRIRLLTDLASNLSLTKVESRIARWMLEEANGNSILRKNWLTQDELASIIGTVPDVISRILRDFVEAGLIRFNRREIKITDRASLTGKVRNLS